jgi:hypothetical protein
MAIAFCAALALPGDAGAATVARLDLPAAVAQADQIVHGRVVRSQPLWSDDGLRIYTDATVQVDETLKGGPVATVTVRLLGGEIGTVGQIVAGAPRLAPGEEVVLLLQHIEGQPVADPPRIVGLAQGLYRIVRPPQSAQALALRDLGGLTLVDLGKQGASAGAASPAAQVDAADQVPLGDLLARLRTLLAGGSR